MLKRQMNYWSLGLFLVLCSRPAEAQRDPGYDHSVVLQVRIDLRDLGYPPVDVIPADESSIRALAVAPDGRLYGTTGGKRSHLFMLDPARGYVLPLGFLEGVSSVEGSLVVSRAGDVFIGTAPGGHLLKYAQSSPRSENVPQVRKPLPVVDLGSPADGERISALAIDRERDRIYGLTRPGGCFFSYAIEGGRFAVHGKVAEHDMPGEKFEKERNIGRAIAIDGDGNAYTSGEGGRLFRFSPSTGTLQRLDITVPSVPGREPYNRVDAWATEGEGAVLYGGTSDGYLFRFEPGKLSVRNLGKPLNRYRVRALVLARNGRLYGVGGDDEEMAQLFSYDPSGGIYELLGMIDVNRRPYYSWQAYVIDCAAVGNDGTIYLGQSERISKLYLYHPEP
jgi:outer membrane protein assembly factor BamB